MSEMKQSHSRKLELGWALLRKNKNKHKSRPPKEFDPILGCFRHKFSKSLERKNKVNIHVAKRWHSSQITVMTSPCLGYPDTFVGP